jgi:hypothetical protein
MADLHVRSDSVDVEQIMKQIRTRIREKRGSDYTEAELQQLASVKLEQFADPSGLRSDLLEQFRQRSNEPSTYHRHRGPRRWLLMLLHPLLKRIQKQLMADLNLYFEIIHNLVVEVTRLGIEVQNLKMRVESLSSRLDFDERRGRALENVVQYRPDAMPRQRPQEAPRPNPAGPPSPMASAAPAGAGNAGAAAAPPNAAPSFGGGRPNEPGRADGERRRRRRRRRRRPGHTMGDRPAGGEPNAGPAPPAGPSQAPELEGPDEDDGAPDQ